MKYALLEQKPNWTLTPWRLMGAKTYNSLSSIPDNEILITSQVPPWQSPLKEYSRFSEYS